ncbi:MAG: helix-turn-helix domain-containing protein [Acidobacteriota bacterium]
MTHITLVPSDRAVAPVQEGLFEIVRARIRLDRSNAPTVALDSLLEVIETHLGEPRLNVSWAKEKAGIRNNSEALFFHIEFGLPPGRYMEMCKLDIATGLLALTDTPIWQIAAAVGYAGMPTFSRAFHRRLGLRPRYARQRYRAVNTDIPDHVTARTLLTVAARPDSMIRFRHRIVTVRRDQRWWPLIHTLENTYATAHAESRRRALRYALNLVRFFELGLEPHGAHVLASVAAPEASENGDGLSILVQELDPAHPDQDYAGRVIALLRRALGGEVETRAWRE